jgi:hypothetical protein
MKVDFTVLLLRYEIACYEMTLAQLRRDLSKERFAQGRLTAYRELLDEYSMLDPAPTISLLRGAKEAGITRAQQDHKLETST